MDWDIIITGLIDGIWHAPKDVLIQAALTFLSNQLLGKYLKSLNHEDKLKAIRTYMII